MVKASKVIEIRYNRIVMTERLLTVLSGAFAEGGGKKTVFWNERDERFEVITERLLKNDKGVLVAMYLNGGDRYGWADEPAFFSASELRQSNMVTWPERAARIKGNSWIKGTGSTRLS